MNRVIIILLTILTITIKASAQIWLSGEAAFSTSSTTLASDKLGTYTTIELNPRIAYQLNSRWAVGLGLGYAHFENAEVKLIDQTVVGVGNRLRLAPFVRHTFWESGNFKFFVDGDIHYDALFMESFESPLRTLGVSIAPGLMMTITEKIGLVTHLGGIGYDHSWMKNRGNYTWMKNPDKTLTNNTIGFHLFDSLSFGIYANL